MTKLQLVAALSVTFTISAACNFKPAPVQAVSEQAGCPSTSELPNLNPGGISPEAISYLKRYAIPTNEPEFCAYLQRLQTEHESKIEDGLIDMMGDYFWSTQTIETGYSFSYKLGSPEKPIPQIIQDRASSEDEMADRFMAAIDSDPDPKRKALFDSLIQKLSAADKVSRKEGVRRLMKLIFDKSWIFNSEFQQAAREVSRDDNYGFVGRGLRTTTPIVLSALVDRFINSNVGKQVLPENISNVLIIGPGLQFSDPDVGQAFPQQSHEPFTLMDSLLRSGKAKFANLRVDLLDINRRVVEHFQDVTSRNSPYVLHIVMNREENAARIPLGVLDYGQSTFGTALPGAGSSMPVQEKSRRPSRGKLEPAEILSRSLTIPPAVVKKLHPFYGDMTTTDLGGIALKSGKKYDAIFCFDTLVYLNETERMLAGVNIREALAENGVFVTDNRFDTDTGERPGRRGDPEKPSVPIFSKSYFEMVADYNEDGTNMGPIQNSGRRTIVYRRGK
jgi:hypothetical protein